MASTRDQRIIEAWHTGDDESFIREISQANIEAAYLPRNESDADVHPESLRGKILATFDEADRVVAAIEAGIAAAPWYKRLWMRPAYWLARKQVGRTAR